jgi:hypothetical protein
VVVGIMAGGSIAVLSGPADPLSGEGDGMCSFADDFVGCTSYMAHKSTGSGPEDGMKCTTSTHDVMCPLAIISNPTQLSHHPFFRRPLFGRYPPALHLEATQPVRL